jgi:hypothetical protein
MWGLDGGGTTWPHGASVVAPVAHSRHARGLIVPIGSTALAFHGPTGCELHEGTDGPDVITTHFTFSRKLG